MIEDANIGLKLEVEDLVVVSPNLVYAHLKEFRLAKVFTFLESDIEVQSYLRMANYMAVDRMGYNDHGPVHSRIISGSALEIFKILSRRFTSTTVKDGIFDLEGAAVVVLCGVYLHDLGNAIKKMSPKTTDEDVFSFFSDFVDSVVSFLVFGYEALTLQRFENIHEGPPR